ncbi:MAG: FliM/FliN family flagellar motor switch protein [Hyphomicrobiaceae bacterium]|nr:FliM/FliN family flagellar motor switch protein [Hyphomicrobiaceae bacterium]
MSADPEKSALKRRAIERMFEHARQPVSELPTVRAVLDAASNRIAKTVSDAIGHDIQVSSAIAQEVTPLEAVVRCEALVAVEYRVQPWAFSGIAGLAPELVFGWLDSMFGGDGSAPPPALARQLTEIEAQIARHLAQAALEAFRIELSEYARMSTSTDAVRWGIRGQEPAGHGENVLLVEIAFAPGDRTILVMLPLPMLEDARSRLVAHEVPEAAPADPDWKRCFRNNVLASDVELVAAAEGPAMTLRDVALLEVGTMIEVEAAAFQDVAIECSGEAVFHGRLGQSKGYFTISIEGAMTRAAAGQPDDASHETVFS